MRRPPKYVDACYSRVFSYNNTKEVDYHDSIIWKHSEINIGYIDAREIQSAPDDEYELENHCALCGILTKEYYGWDHLAEELDENDFPRCNWGIRDLATKMLEEHFESDFHKSLLCVPCADTGEIDDLYEEHLRDFSNYGS